MGAEENAQAIEDDIEIDLNAEDTANPGDEGEDKGGEGKAPAMSDSIEIVQEGGESQAPKTNQTKNISDRINQVNKVRDEAKDRANAEKSRADRKSVV